jgi:stage III sporulation protein AD
MLLIKIIFIAVITILLSMLISKVNEEYKLYFILIFGIVAVLMIFSELKGHIGNMFSVFSNYNIKIDNFTLLLKIVGIAYICDFVSLICKDLDYESIGKKIEMSGKLIILIYSFNVILKFIDEVYLLVNR